MAALVATPAMPLVTEQMRKMCRILEDKTKVDLLLSRHALADSLEILPSAVPASSTVRTLRQDPDHLVTRLMLALPTHVAVSLAQHTLAYDFGRDQQARPSTYSHVYRGVYATAIRIEGRDGRFLTSAELKKVRGRIISYVDAAEKWCRDGDSLSAGERDAIDRLDRHYISAQRARSRTGPRFIEGKKTVVKFRRFVEMLRRYQYVGAPGGAPADDTQPMIQCPQMVGCTTRAIYSRVEQHRPDSGLQMTTSTWACMLCAIKEIGLEPLVVGVPILNTVDLKELQVGEQLITTIAQSLVTQDGFNIIEGGGQDDRDNDADYDTRQTYVHGTTTWLHNSIAAAEKELIRREEIRTSAVESVKRNKVIDSLIKLGHQVYAKPGKTWLLFCEIMDAKEYLSKRQEAHIAEIARITGAKQHLEDGSEFLARLPQLIAEVDLTGVPELSHGADMMDLDTDTS
ncbi:hypothetical protein B0T16DRAFT_394889 [Cercophora newfieldiana]|uniref:Uncharacterized protein n=1 Tax=Cercophora newfieldiana TaxID=92897 RepID=A0AA40CIU9_9PEZI|nr:hypothetical protein B0T16DRAFT_394889 [Cercophora newfieldiana]